MNGQMEGYTVQGVGEGRELQCPLLSTPPSRKLHVFSNLDALQTPAFLDFDGCILAQM